ncbi:hydroxypyruvate reductase [Comamonas testosteroni]|uniref:Hydroxypyruvate reductase n=2 Tax=Comamonas testosteroni TaxID=285 RepID=A0A5A7MK73_COMTE|nr:hydroxypyruvate reductase [Comamonas testosteroni]
MAHAFESLWPTEAPMSGFVVTRYGHTPPRPSDVKERISIVEAAHPVPDAESHRAALHMLKLTKGLTKDDLVVFLVSGGGSALLSLPAEGLDLVEKQRINHLLLQCGADIREMNCVRKHLSAIKGGHLAQACMPARLVTLAISDVPGDEVSVIASGPTVADSTTCMDALEIIRRYRIAVPNSIEEALISGTLETPKPSASCFKDSEVHVIATPHQSLVAAAELAQSQGVQARIMSDDIEGESREVGMVHAAIARYEANARGASSGPLVLLSGGETTVTVQPHRSGAAPGRGGRAGEFCMGLAHALQAHPRIWALAADTDGIDGVEDNAGAFVSPDTLARCNTAGLSLGAHMARNDSYGLFAALGDLHVTGPTHTNVNDFRAMLIL